VLEPLQHPPWLRLWAQGRGSLLNSGAFGLVFFVDLRVFMKTCGLLVFGLVFADFCLANCFFSNFTALLLFHFTTKRNLDVFLCKFAHFGLFRICLPAFIFHYLLVLCFLIFLPNSVGLASFVILPIFGLFFKLAGLFLQNSLASLACLICAFCCFRFLLSCGAFCSGFLM